MIPIWSRWIDNALPLSMFKKNYHIGIKQIGGILLPGIFLAFVILWIVRPQPIFDKEIPIRGVLKLKEFLLKGKIYNYREWGGPLIFEGAPNWKVAIDGRLYLFKKAEWKEYFEAALGEIPLHNLIEKHHPDAFFLRPSFHGQLIRELRRSFEWRELYTDKYCSIFIKGL